MSEPILLSLESSGNFGSVCLSRGGALLYAATSFLDQSHAAMMAPLVKAGMEAANIRASDIDAVAVGAGPGSYTGLRIGISLAKGFCFALQIPLISVGTMNNLAHQSFAYHQEAEKVLCVLDARRNEVYAALFGKGGRILVPVQALVLDERAGHLFSENDKLILAGDGAKKTIEFFGNPEKWMASQNLYPDARTVAAIALQKFKKNEFEDLALFEPEYIKPVYFSQPEK